MPMMTKRQLELQTRWFSDAVCRMARAEAKLTGVTPDEIAERFLREYQKACNAELNQWKRDKYGVES